MKWLPRKWGALYVLLVDRSFRTLLDMQRNRGSRLLCLYSLLVLSIWGEPKPQLVYLKDLALCLLQAAVDESAGCTGLGTNNLLDQRLELFLDQSFAPAHRSVVACHRFRHHSTL